MTAAVLQFSGSASDAICCYMASNADAAEKQIVANQIAAKVMIMADSLDVMLVAVSVSSRHCVFL